MKKLKLLSTILLIALIVPLFIMPSAAISDPEPEASSVALMDIETGNILYAKNGTVQAAPASLTKIMTVMLAVEDIELGIVSQYDSVTASANMTYDLIEDGSTAGIVVDETMTLEELLYCAMLSSANEACNVIAEHISGSISAFVARMNARAAELGCTDTNFVNTHGLPASGHYTTAEDMARIAQSAMAHPLFAEIVNTATITISATNKSDARALSNTNGLINSDASTYKGYYYEYASGVKTGYTDAAGYCLVSTAKKNGVNLLCVVMGGKATPIADGIRYGNFTDTISMYNWAFENYSYRDILKVTDLVKDVPVEMGSEMDFVSVHPQNAVRALLPNDDDLQSFIQKIRIYSEETGEGLVAPVEAGQVLGEISIERNGVIYGTSSLVASSSISLNYSRFISARIAETLKKPAVIVTIMVIVLLLAAYIFLVVRYYMSRRAYIKKKQAENPRRNDKLKQADKSLKTPAAAPNSKAPPSSQLTYLKIPEEQSKAVAEAKAERDYFEEFFGNK